MSVDDKAKFILGGITGEMSGSFEEEDFSKTNKPIIYGPAPPGLMGYVEAALLLGWFKKLNESPEGQRILRDIVIKYLDVTSDVLCGLYKSSAAHPVTAMVNSRVSLSIYKRLGLMNSADATREQGWIDHIIGETLLSERVSLVGNMLSGVATLVEAPIKALSGTSLLPKLDLSQK